MKNLINDVTVFKNNSYNELNLYIYNLSAIKLIKNPEFHGRSKHIDERYHFIQDKFNKKEFFQQYSIGGSTGRPVDKTFKKNSI